MSLLSFLNPVGWIKQTCHDASHLDPDTIHDIMDPFHAQAKYGQGGTNDSQPSLKTKPKPKPSNSSSNGTTSGGTSPSVYVPPSYDEGSNPASYQYGQQLQTEQFRLRKPTSVATVFQQNAKPQIETTEKGKVSLAA